MIQNKDSGLFKTCDELFPNCEECNEDGTSCNRCATRFMQVNDGNSQVCKSCAGDFTEQCEVCNEQEGCL